MRKIYNLFKLLVYTSVTASILALIIILIKILFKNKFSASWNYYIWLLVFIRLILPYSFTSSLSLNNLISFSKPASIIHQPVLNTGATVNKNHNAATNLSKSHKLNTEYNYNIVTATNSETSLKTGNLYSYENIICILWLLGIGIISFYIIFPYIIFKIKIKNEPFSTNDYTAVLLYQCKQRLKIKSNISLIYSNNVNVPSLIGIIKPSILVPNKMITNLTSNEINYIFIHELVHYKRKDNFLFLIITLTLVLYWFNPILWVCFKFMKKDCELSCDAAVLSYLNSMEYKIYGETLLKLTEYININKIISGTSTIISNKNIKRRIIMISKFKKKSLLWIVIALILTVIIGFTGLTNSKTIVKKSIKNNTNNVTKANDNLKGENKKETVSINKDISNNNLKEQSNTADTKAHSISEEEFKKLIIDSDINISHYYILYNDIEHPVEGNYVKLDQDFTTYDTLYKHFDEKLSLSKYYTKRYINEFISSITKKIDGRYCIELFNMGIPIKDAEIISQKWDDNGNKLVITCYITVADNDKYEDTVTLYYDGNWKIDSIVKVSN